MQFIIDFFTDLFWFVDGDSLGDGPHNEQGRRLPPG